MTFYGPGTPGKMRMCPDCGSLQVIDFADYNIHRGSHYFVRGSTTLGNGGTMQWSVETPDSDTWLHMFYKITASDPANVTVAVYEGVTDIAGGSPVVPINSNRNSSNTSGATIKAGATVTLGDLIESSSGDIERSRPLILKQNAKYLWRVVSTTADNLINYHGNWCEHASVV
jgi:hypothetical protein